MIVFAELLLAATQENYGVIDPAYDQAAEISDKKTVNGTDEASDESYVIANKELAQQSEMRSDFVTALENEPVGSDKDPEGTDDAEDESQNMPVETQNSLLQKLVFAFRLIWSCHFHLLLK